MIRKISLLFISNFLLFSLIFQPIALANNINEINGAQIFELNCAGCHPKGSNIIRRGKNLKQKTLIKNGFDSVKSINYLIANGKNNMSAFKDRLTEQEINEVANYVLIQAKNNWK